MTNFKRLLCQWESPELIASRLIEEWGEAGFIWLDGDGSELGRWVTLAINPLDQFCSRKIKGSSHESNPFNILRELPPGHWTGWLSYEAASWIEPQNPWKSSSIATLWIASHDPVLKFDLHKKELWLEGQDQKRISIIENFLKSTFNQRSSKHDNRVQKQIKKDHNIPLEAWEWKLTSQEYSKKVDEIKHWIASGDIFQANLTTSCQASLPMSMNVIDVYSKLKKFSPAPFSGVVIGDKMAKGEAIISTSPERFLKALPSGEVETRPIKGTRPRDNDPDKDAH